MRSTHIFLITFCVGVILSTIVSFIDYVTGVRHTGSLLSLILSATLTRLIGVGMIVTMILCYSWDKK